jgi:ubiquinone/menaquinone biosynthesis C-methylase UbiE
VEYREDAVTVNEHGTRTTDLFDYDAELRLHNELFRAAARVDPHDHVLDIGCGTGQTTRDAARAATSGSALGVDVSTQMLEQARQLTDNQELPNITYEQADAQLHPFPPTHFDLCISRFGTMFFADPVAAFTNIGRALRPTARLVLLVWQARDRNEWATAIRQALTPAKPTPTKPTSGPDAFSLADPTTTEGILTTAGFAEVNFTDVHEPVYYGPDTATAYNAVLRLWDVKDQLANVDAATADQTRTRLRATLEKHKTNDGVYFDSRAWLITARRH